MSSKVLSFSAFNFCLVQTIDYLQKAWSMPQYLPVTILFGFALGAILTGTFFCLGPFCPHPTRYLYPVGDSAQLHHGHIHPFSPYLWWQLLPVQLVYYLVHQRSRATCLNHQNTSRDSLRCPFNLPDFLTSCPSRSQTSEPNLKFVFGQHEVHLPSRCGDTKSHLHLAADEKFSPGSCITQRWYVTARRYGAQPDRNGNRWGLNPLCSATRVLRAAVH